MQLASGGTVSLTKISTWQVLLKFFNHQVGQLALEHRGEGGGHGGGDVSGGKYEGQGMMVGHRGEGEHGLLIIRQHGVEEQYSNVSLSFNFVASLAILKFNFIFPGWAGLNGGAPAQQPRVPHRWHYC